MVTGNDEKYQILPSNKTKNVNAKQNIVNWISDKYSGIPFSVISCVGLTICT